MKAASARSSRASPPLRTTKRAPEIFPARAKSICRKPSPSATWSFGVKAKLRGEPWLRKSLLSRSSLPSGTSSRGMFRMPASSASISALRRPASPSSRACSSLLAATCCMIAPASPPFAFTAPISRASLLRSAWSASALVCAARHSLSKARISGDFAGRPRRASPLSKAAGSSRMIFRSNMARHYRSFVRLCRGLFLGLAFRALFLDQLAGEDRNLEQEEQRNGQRHHAENVGRREHGRQAEHAHDRIAPLFCEPCRRDQSGTRHQAQEHRQLERHAERQHQMHDESQVFADLRLEIDGQRAVAAARPEAHEEGIGDGKNHVIDQRTAHNEEKRRRDEIRQEGAALLLIEAGRNEQPDLAGNDRKGETESRPKSDPQIGKERFCDIGEDEMSAARVVQRVGERLGEKIVDVLAEVP